MQIVNQPAILSRSQQAPMLRRSTSTMTPSYVNAPRFGFLLEACLVGVGLGAATMTSVFVGQIRYSLNGNYMDSSALVNQLTDSVKTGKYRIVGVPIIKQSGNRQEEQTTFQIGSTTYTLNVLKAKRDENQVTAHNDSAIESYTLTRSDGQEVLELSRIYKTPNDPKPRLRCHCFIKRDYRRDDVFYPSVEYVSRKKIPPNLELLFKNLIQSIVQSKMVEAGKSPVSVFSTKPILFLEETESANH